MTLSKVPLTKTQKAFLVVSRSSRSVVFTSDTGGLRWSIRAWLGPILNLMQISNGQAVPLGPGLQNYR